jgi:hypothetical protein
VAYNKIIIYDDACPLCEWYTKLFVKYKFIQAHNKKSFSTIDPDLLKIIDVDRACKEIPLIDPSTQKVVYGIDTLLDVLDQKMPFIKTIGNMAPINWFLKKLYKLISFNRKGIIAAVPNGIGFNCTPAYSYNYKKYFIAILFVLTVLIYLCLKSTYIQPALQIALIVNAGVVVLAIFSTNKNILETVSQYILQYFIANILLLPLLVLQYLPSIVTLIYSLILGVFIAFQVYKRLTYLLYYYKTDK